MTFDINQFGLNQSQQEAVNWQDGPLLVLAGPGSGKTRVLTCRIARLVAESVDARFRVLGVTFTNKAATEMRQRIDGLLTTGRERVTLTTFHAFSAEILRQHGSHVGLKPDFGILTEQGDREAALQEAINTVISPEDDFAPTPSQLLPFISRLLDKCVTPTQAVDLLAKRAHGDKLAAIYAAYRSRLISSNQLDFGSLLALAVELLESKPAIAKQIRRVYAYVCVDECQDTNAAQSRLLLQLVPETDPNLFIVADDDQVIYQWNGANPDRLRKLGEQYEMSVLQLPENYRCPPAVIELANNLIRHNTDRSSDKKPLTAHKVSGGSSGVTVMHFPTFNDELRWIANQLMNLPVSDRSGCVILARRKKLLEVAVTVLSENAVPAYIAIRKNEFESGPYRFLHAALRLANASQDTEQLRRLSRAYFDLEGIKIENEDVVALAAIEQVGLLRSWLQVAIERSEVSQDTIDLLRSCQSSLAERLDYWPFINSAHLWFKYLKEHSENKGIESALSAFDDEADIWNSLQSEIAQHYNLAEMSLHAFLQELDLRVKEKPAPPNAVRCLTIAASKGMEFKHVFLIGLVEEELPGYYATKKGDLSDEMREERRNCFVAITRAEDTLTLTYADRYFGYSKAPSRFLAEMEVPG